MQENTINRGYLHLPTLYKTKLSLFLSIYGNNDINY